MVIGIIGAGASGMAAALAASENSENRILLFERQARVGRKLQATGNGRCNLTNMNCTEDHFHGDQPSFAYAALHTFPSEDTVSWFRELGLYTVSEPGGRVYPYSDQANSVVDVLRFALQKENISLLTGSEVMKVKKDGNGFLVVCSDESHYCDRIIIACGGLAGTKLGGSMSGYKLLRSLGHRSTRLRPSLVQLKSSWRGCASLKGVRANCRAAIFHNGNIRARSEGELQFTEYGLSGPVIFEVSRDACNGAGEWICQLDFLPHESAEALAAELYRRREKNLPMEELLTGVLHNRLGRILTQAAGVRSGTMTGSLTETEIEELCHTVKCFEVPITEPLGMDSAQVTAGGIITEDFDPLTMESRLVTGLYACGEVLDIDGDCGGFNLQWAWCSGRLAGQCAGGVEK